MKATTKKKSEWISKRDKQPKGLKHLPSRHGCSMFFPLSGITEGACFIQNGRLSKQAGVLSNPQVPTPAAVPSAQRAPAPSGKMISVSDSRSPMVPTTRSKRQRGSWQVCLQLKRLMFAQRIKSSNSHWHLAVLCWS